MLNKLILLLCFCGLVFSQNSPVFLWGSSSSFKPALKSLSANEFAEIISPNLKDSMLVIFTEEDLQTQDFTQCKLESGETCFSNLKTYKIKTFYADVEDPIKSIKSLAKNDKIQVLTVGNDGKLSKNIKYQVGKIVLISLDKKLQERSKALIEHDSIMSDIYKMISTEGKVTAIYTSQENSQSLHRVRRQTKADPPIYFSGKDNDIGIMFYTTKVSLGTEKLDITKMVLKKESDGKKDVDVTLTTSKGDLVFKVSESKGYWYIQDVNLGGDEKFITDIESAVGFSYYCGNVVVRSNKNNVLTLADLQIEAFYNKEFKKFNDPWHCVGFISGGIISGLFVSLMFIIIMSIGITWLMDIRTMDRFDDPKGKTITINVTD